MADTQTPAPANVHLVGAKGDHVMVGVPPRLLTPDEALALAAWLVAIAECMTQTKFADVYRDVINT